MTDGSETDVTRLLRDLTRELQKLQREVDRERRTRSTRRQLSRFTSEVAIPGLILLLETNIRALKLLRRTIRLAEGREPEPARGRRTADEMRNRAEQLGQATLSRLDESLAEIQSTVEQRDGDEEIEQMLSEARQLQQQIRNQLGSTKSISDGDEPGDREGIGLDTEGTDDEITLDVDAELRTLKESLEDDEPPGEGNGSGASGADPDESGEGNDEQP